MNNSEDELHHESLGEEVRAKNREAPSGLLDRSSKPVFEVERLKGRKT